MHQVLLRANSRRKFRWLAVAAVAGWLVACATVPVAHTANSASAAPAMRIDYFHTGDREREIFSLDEVVREPLAWPGNPRRPLDELPRGKYFFEIIDTATSAVLYSRSFSSIYGEWETTGEARSMTRTFHESLRFPDPGRPVTAVVSKRNARHDFVEVWRIAIDPADYLVRSAVAPLSADVVAIVNNGDPADKVDLLILGDGYTAAERDKFLARARELSAALFATEPFRTRRDDFNVWALAPPAARSGVSRPSTGVHRNSPIGARYDAFRSERYILTFDNKALREIAASSAYDFIEILTNSDTYGGGGIYGLFSTAAAHSEWAPYLFIHEFGHHFAGLADEYYTSPVSYEAPASVVEPYEPNVTALLDPDALKWRALVAPGTPIPTPWPKSTYDEYARDYQARRVRLREQERPESEMNALFRTNQDFIQTLFSSTQHRHQVGAFEGANYESQGMYRSQLNCLMFTRSDTFCAVCSAALEEMIDRYSR